MNNIEIKVVGGPSGTEVIVDGKRVEHVRKLTLVHEVGCAPVLSLECILPNGAIVTGQAEVKEMR